MIGLTRFGLLGRGAVEANSQADDHEENLLEDAHAEIDGGVGLKQVEPLDVRVVAQAAVDGAHDEQWGTGVDGVQDDSLVARHLVAVDGQVPQNGQQETQAADEHAQCGLEHWGDGVGVEGLDRTGDTKGQSDQADDADEDEDPFGELVDRGVSETRHVYVSLESRVGGYQGCDLHSLQQTHSRQC